MTGRVEGKVAFITGEVGVLVGGGRVGAGRDAEGQRGGVRRTGVHPARGGLPAKRDLAVTVLDQPLSMPVGGQVEVLVDGGIGRGGDVVKALALGAKAVMIGRAYLWGLADNGQAGVENVLDILRGGIDSALLGLGKASVRDLAPGDLVIPPGFTRTLGGDSPVFDPALNQQAAG
jgi:hypothetical protein